MDPKRQDMTSAEVLSLKNDLIDVAARLEHLALVLAGPARIGNTKIVLISDSDEQKGTHHE
jgi:hypothetical protein